MSLMSGFEPLLLGFSLTHEAQISHRLCYSISFYLNYGWQEKHKVGVEKRHFILQHQPF